MAAFDHSFLWMRFAAWYSASASAESTSPSVGCQGAEVLRGDDAEALGQHRTQRLDLHLAEPRERLEVRAQLGAVGGIGPHASGVAVVGVAEVRREVVHSLAITPG